MAGNKGFFAVGSETLKEACALGINPACAFLVIASGTGGDNITSSWSAKAGAKYLGVRWTKVNEAIKKLEEHKIINRVKRSKETDGRPLYKLEKKGPLLWIPNSIVEGAAGETSPLMRVRQTQDAMTLRLLIELYGVQNLREDGGIPITLYRSNYKRSKVGEHEQFVVWGFSPDSTSMWWDPISNPHKREALTKEELKEGQNKGIDFFRRWESLSQLGLVEMVPYLFEGDQGEPLHPIWWGGDDLEVSLFEAVKGAAMRCVTPGQFEWAKNEGLTIFVPVAKHMRDATIFAMGRLRYRPHTKATGEWWGNYQQTCERFTLYYQVIAADKKSAAGEDKAA